MNERQREIDDLIKQFDADESTWARDGVGSDCWDFAIRSLKILLWGERERLERAGP